MSPITQNEYWEEIDSIIENALDEYKAHGKDEEPDEWLSDWMHQTIDGHQWIIYNYYNPQVLDHSNNPDAYWEEMGETPSGESFSDLTPPLAFMAMNRDVYDRLDMDPFHEVYREDDEDEDEDEDEGDGEEEAKEEKQTDEEWSDWKKKFFSGRRGRR